MSTIRSEPGEVWRITLDRPEARNAVTAEMLEDLAAALGDGAADLLITGREVSGREAAGWGLMAADALASEDLAEGLRARNERRPPRFRGT